MFTFSARCYAPHMARLLEPAAPIPLDAGTPHEALRGPLEALAQAPEFSSRAIDRDMADCCRSGLWLRHNFLDESHLLSQHITTPSGSYWHALMHRREGDFENAKYWFRRVGAHEIFPLLAAEAGAWAASEPREPSLAFLATQRTWNAGAFVDACATAVRGLCANPALVQRVAQLEWELLFDHCYRAAVEEVRREG